MDEREAGAEEDADCIPHTSVPLAWTRVDRVIARRMRTQRKAAELEYLVKWQARWALDPSPRPQLDMPKPQYPGLAGCAWSLCAYGCAQRYGLAGCRHGSLDLP